MLRQSLVEGMDVTDREEEKFINEWKQLDGCKESEEKIGQEPGRRSFAKSLRASGCKTQQPTESCCGKSRREAFIAMQRPRVKTRRRELKYQSHQKLI